MYCTVGHMHVYGIYATLLPHSRANYLIQATAGEALSLVAYVCNFITFVTL